MNHHLAFVLVVEAGDLEHKSVLLIESIRKFTGVYKDSPIWVVQPRRGRRLSQNTIEAFNDNQVFFLNVDLNQIWKNYGVANKLYASAMVEALVAGKVDNLVFLDSDIIFVQPPDELILKPGEVIAVRPVDIINVGVAADQPLNDYWDACFQACGVKDSQIWSVKTTLEQQEILAYFNSGLISVNPSAGLFQTWKDNLERLALNPKIQTLSPGSKEYFHLDQAILAGTILANTSQSQVKLLNNQYNYPLNLHVKNSLPPHIKEATLTNLAVVHYHHIFYHLNWIEHIGVEEPLRSWLLARLPLLNLKSKWAGVPGFAQLRQKSHRLGHRTLAKGA